jgi:hypothetical protein
MKTIWTSGKEGVPLVSRAAMENKDIHLCIQCGKDMGYEWLLGPVCGKCCRANHRKVAGRK